MLSIALTKGRLEKATVKLLKECGYGTEALENKGRSLVFQDSVKDVRYFLAKAADCITYVEHGVADAAVTGKDTLIENPGEYYELLDLKIGKCCFILGGLPGRNPLTKNGLVRIASKYPEVARKYFRNKGMDVEIIRIEGSVELAPLLGLCDGIIDIMETGTTLKENGLVVFDTVEEISARLIVNKASFRLKQDEIMALLDDMKGMVEKRCSEE